MSKKITEEIELNRIYQRECIEGMTLIPDKSIDMILCDLPYGTTACKWDTIIPFEQLWEQYERVIKDNGAIVLTASQPFTSALIMSNVSLFKYSWTWVKSRPTGHLNAKKQPLRTTEDVCVFYKKQCTYTPQMVKRNESEMKKLPYAKKRGVVRTDGVTRAAYGESMSRETHAYKYPTNTLFINNVSNLNGEKVAHPTQKPTELFEYLIRTYSNEGDVVLDNCMGSGTTAVACVRNNRKFIGFELEREYVEIANKRLDAETEVNG